jgi:hypothetical protein
MLTEGHYYAENSPFPLHFEMCEKC